MKDFECTLCGYIYKPTEHENIDFIDLPADWVCPVCGASKDNFEEIL